MHRQRSVKSTSRRPSPAYERAELRARARDWVDPGRSQRACSGSSPCASSARGELQAGGEGQPAAQGGAAGGGSPSAGRITLPAVHRAGAGCEYELGEAAARGVARAARGGQCSANCRGAGSQGGCRVHRHALSAQAGCRALLQAVARVATKAECCPGATARCRACRPGPCSCSSIFATTDSPCLLAQSGARACQQREGSTSQTGSARRRRHHVHTCLHPLHGRHF